MKQLRGYWLKGAGFLLMAASAALPGCTGQGSRNDPTLAQAGKSRGCAGRDTICVTGPSQDCRLGFNGRSGAWHLVGPFTTNVRADSICWELVYASPGISMEPKTGKGSHSMVTFIRRKDTPAGEAVIRVCPFRSGFISRPYAFAVTLQDNRPASGKPACIQAECRNRKSCPPDTGIINRDHRMKIIEFRDLLFMFAKTTSSRERDYFKAGAERKLNEIGGSMAGLSRNSDLGDLFTDPPAALPLVIPVYDDRRCYITGIRIMQP